LLFEVPISLVAAVRLASIQQLPLFERYAGLLLLPIADAYTGHETKVSKAYFGGSGCTGFGPNALAVSRWGRFVRESARWRDSSAAPCSL
jgi:hypothetical protein